MPQPTPQHTLLHAFELMATAKSLTELYEDNFKLVSKYVHATSRGHEAVQIAAGMLLQPQDFAYPYYRDDAFLLSIGCTPHSLMLQLMAKATDPYSGGRTYYAHPSLKDADKPNIPHQSSATGMQAIPATGAAMGLQYIINQKIKHYTTTDQQPIVLCSIGDGAMTEGEVAEALQMAALKQLPILYLVQDNEWDISAYADEVRAADAAHYAQGFKGIEIISINGSDFDTCYQTLHYAINIVRMHQRPVLVHCKVPLLNHHTSGVRKEWYRHDLEKQATQDPYPILKTMLEKMGLFKQITDIELRAKQTVQQDFEQAQTAPEPTPDTLTHHIFAPTPIVNEQGSRTPNTDNNAPVIMVDAALHAIDELMTQHPTCVLYGQDVGARLGGVFREAATLADKFGKNRVFNTPIQEAFIVGSTVGMSAVGLQPIVEVQFADYIFPALNQLFTEVSRSCYLTNGKYPVGCVVRVPIGAYGSGGPYHSSSIESILTNIQGIKICYPSTAADLKGLMKAAFYDPNPVIMLEHKGLYWSKTKGTEAAKTPEPTADYILPLGKANVVLHATTDYIATGNSCVVITYGMGVHWALNAAKEPDLIGKIEIIDLRTLYPLDMDTVCNAVQTHGKCLVLTEEPQSNGFAQGLAGKISQRCFGYLDAAVQVQGAADTPAIPLNSVLEQAALPNAQKVANALRALLSA
jgi:2-oxoisovalerate dehydrogenase E1 component